MHQDVCAPKTRRIAYLILAHKDPAQLRLLIEALQSPGVEIFIHLDARESLHKFRAGLPPLPGLHFVRNRRTIYWGGLSMVRAELELLRTALNQGPFDSFVLLSGDSYPVVPHQTIVEQLSTNQQFMDLYPMTEDNEFRNIRRLSTYYVPAKIRYTPWQNYANLWLNKLPQRNWKKRLGPMQPYGGWQWWALTRDCVEYIFQFLKQHPTYWLTYFWTFVPDESFFQTIVGNSPFACQTQPGLMYTDWTRNPPPHPSVLQTADLPYIQASGKCFARKFDESQAPGFCSQIDSELRQARLTV